VRILILSRNPALYSTNSIAVAARRKGHHVRIVDHVNCDLVVDNKKNVVIYHGEHITGYDAVIPRIGSSVTSYGSMVVRQFESMGIYSTLSSSALLLTRDKLSSLQILSSAYLPVPKTAITNNYYSFSNILKYIVRRAKPGEFRSNLHRGATSQKIELTEEEENVAIKAAKTMGLKIAGVDILRSSRGPLIMEVNASPGLEGIEGTTRVNVAKEIIEYVERNYKNTTD